MVVGSLAGYIPLPWTCLEKALSSDGLDGSISQQKDANCLSSFIGGWGEFGKSLDLTAAPIPDRRPRTPFDPLRRARTT